MAKTHYALCDHANESDNSDYWSSTLCGLEETESPLSDRINNVDCKHCLRIYPKFREQMENIQW